MVYLWTTIIVNVDMVTHNNQNDFLLFKNDGYEFEKKTLITMGVYFGFSYLSNMGLHIYMHIIKAVLLMLTNY